MSATHHFPPAPPAVTRLAAAAVLAALVACGAMFADAAAGSVTGVGVLEAVALAVSAGWWLATRVTPAWGGETDRLARAEARALAGWLCGAARRAEAGAAVGGAVLLAAAGLAESGDALVALGLAALAGWPVWRSWRSSPWRVAAVARILRARGHRQSSTAPSHCPRPAAATACSSLWMSKARPEPLGATRGQAPL